MNAMVQVNPAAAGYAALVLAFQRAKAAGLKYPALTFETVTFKLAGDKSKNPGCLYVTAGKKYGSDYYGKVTPAGQFQAAWGCPPGIAETVKQIGADPLGQSIAHGKKTGNCACCNKTLTDPVSVAQGIGPVCYKRFFGNTGN